MPETLNMAKLTLNLATSVQGNSLMLARRLRGAVASFAYEDLLLHQHTDNGQVYIYPRVQYRVHDGTAVLLGIEEGVESLVELADRLPGQKLCLGGNRLLIRTAALDKRTVDFGVIDEPITYTFKSPWLAFNNHNFLKYKRENSRGRINLLKSLLIANCLSMAKSLGVFLDDTIRVGECLLQETFVRFKDIDMLAFEGVFVINFVIPAGFGIGKSPSRGFGEIGARIDSRQLP